MNTADYQRFLADAGFTTDEAAKIARLRLREAKNQKAGTIAFEAKKDAGEIDILLYDFIGFDFWTGEGITPQWLADQLKEAGPVNHIRVRINSGGGSVFDGMAIYNILRRQEAKVSVDVEGIAASIASVIAMAADPGQLRIAESAMMMIHRATTMFGGNADEAREIAAVLDKMDGQIASVYAARSGRSAAEWVGLMDKETWFTGAEAVEHRLADALVDLPAIAACVDCAALRGFRNAPAEWVEKVRAENDEAKQREQEAEAVRVKMRMLELEGAI